MADLIQIYRDTAKQWRWRRKAKNGKITADSGEGYEDLEAAWKAASREAKEEDELEVLDES